ncbi:MAG: 3-phosphoserine/phosphohydroxythreonine transaminase [Oscillospiraceae bacterium]|nr:3-phosphoserine/phosphohydroxythreonine transaminase [Oscillospiraceae bacterium]
MSEKRIYNFAAGPSTLPLEVLEQAKEELINYGGSGMSVMEMSHRSKLFLSIFEQTKSDLRRILNVPETHEILFLQGGATLQFAMTAMNLITATGKADYVLTGSFATKAYDEAKKYGDVAVAASSKDRNHSYIPAQSELNVRDDISYLYYTANNTIYGTEWKYVPQVNAPLVCDMSSDILTQPIDFEKYSVVFAGAQKNMSPAGLTVVFINKDYAGHALPYTPVMLDYAAMIKGDSMHNTPPCWCIYMLGLVLKWMDAQGGLSVIEQRKKEKAKILYDVIDASSLYKGCAEKDSRSDMNVTFVTGDPEMDKRFIAGAKEIGIENVNGHRSVGGMRASIYNAMSFEGVRALAEYMKDFEKKA